jgi:hypothetical protein
VRAHKCTTTTTTTTTTRYYFLRSTTATATTVLLRYTVPHTPSGRRAIYTHTILRATLCQYTRIPAHTVSLIHTSGREPPPRISTTQNVSTHLTQPIGLLYFVEFCFSFLLFSQTQRCKSIRPIESTHVNRKRDGYANFRDT